MTNPVIAVKKIWAWLPADVQICLHGLWSAAMGGALTAAAVYYADHNHHTIQAVKESWGFILAGATGAAALYLRTGPISKWKWDRAVERGEAVERRANPPVLPPAVIVMPENPPGDPLNKKE